MCDPTRVRMTNVRFQDNFNGLPMVSFAFVRTLEGSQSADDTRNRKYSEEEAADWLTDLNHMRVEAVEKNIGLFRTLQNIAISIKDFCDQKNYDYSTVTLDPKQPPILMPDSTVRICLQVMGKVMAPEPKELQEVSNGQ